jgi:3D (Asp-Asp-Asp) domain-containing protein
MRQIQKTSLRIEYPIDLSILLSAAASLFILFAVLAYRPHIIMVLPNDGESRTLEEPRRIIPFTKTLSQLFKEIPHTDDSRTAHLEEVPEYSAVLYAVEPIGRYYITAYNHEETGGKRAASGTTCHEGTVTTCAADVWGGYFKFGDYIEVGGRLYRVEDTGSAVKKRHIDIYFASYKEMARYGSHYETIYRVTFPFGKPKDA